MADASPESDGAIQVDASSADAPLGPIRVTALRAGSPRVGTRVIVHDDSGVPLNDLVPDSDGTVTLDDSPPRTITIAFAPEGQAADRVLTFTLVSVEPGEQIVVDVPLQRPALRGAVTTSYTLPGGTVGQTLDLGCARRQFNHLVTASTLDVLESCPEDGARFNALLTAITPPQPAAWALFQDQVTTADAALTVAAWSTQWSSIPVTWVEPTVPLSEFSFTARLALDGVWHDADQRFPTSLPAASEGLVLRVPSGVGETFAVSMGVAFGPPNTDGPVVRKPRVAAHWIGSTPTAPSTINFSGFGVPLVHDLARDSADTTGRTLTWREEGTPAELAAVDGVAVDLARLAGSVMYTWQIVAPHGSTSLVRLPVLPDDLSARMPGTNDLSIELALVRIAAGGGAPAFRAQAGGWVRTAFNARPPVDASFTSVVSSRVVDE